MSLLNINGFRVCIRVYLGFNFINYYNEGSIFTFRACVEHARHMNTNILRKLGHIKKHLTVLC